jgi:GT2 family glycosyltransferase
MNHVVIIARNNRPMTWRTLVAALAQDVEVTVVVVDNASTDGTAEWLRAVSMRRSNVIVLTCPKQLSLAACWNNALRFVWSRGGEHALVLNNDVVLLPSTYRILDWVGQPFVTTVSVDDEAQFKEPESMAFNGRPHPNFSGFLIRKSVTDKVGWFNEAYYPAYCEDAEYHVRMFRAGINAICIDLPMLHIGNGANTLRFANPAEAAAIKRGADANRERFKAVYGCKPGEPAYEALFQNSGTPVIGV